MAFSNAEYQRLEKKFYKCQSEVIRLKAEEKRLNLTIIEIKKALKRDVDVIGQSISLTGRCEQCKANIQGDKNA